MKLLAIDSATECLALAAVDDGRAGPESALLRAHCRIEALELQGGPAASAQALPALQTLLDRLGWRYADLDAVAFGRGPGGFTGLRTACAVAQGLAFGCGIPVVPVDSLAIVAEQAAPGPASQADAVRDQAGVPVWVLMDARMDEIYAGAYADDGCGGWREVVAPALTTPDRLNDAWRENPPQRVAGSALAVFGARLALPGVPAASAAGGRAAALGWLAAAGFARGDAVPADQALPVYLRDKVAQTTVEREAARAAVAAHAGPALPGADLAPRPGQEAPR